MLVWSIKSHSGLQGKLRSLQLCCSLLRVLPRTCVKSCTYPRRNVVAENNAPEMVEQNVGRGTPFSQLWWAQAVSDILKVAYKEKELYGSTGMTNADTQAIVVPKKKTLFCIKNPVWELSEHGIVVTDFFASTSSTARACMPLEQHRVWSGFKRTLI